MLYLLRVKGGENMDFVICDDEAQFRKKTAEAINKAFINNKDEYYITEFGKFDKDFAKLIKTKTPKIYILDIEIKDSISGIDIARKIRSNDWESVIILVTSHNELGFQALKAQIMLLDFISKYDSCEKNLINTLEIAMELVKKKRIMKFEYNGVSYIVHYNDILYVERDTVDRKCIIRTSYTSIPINRSLSSLQDELGGNFYLCHRSCIVNTSNIEKIDWKNNIIYFVDGQSIDLISRDKRKGLKEYVNN